MEVSIHRAHPFEASRRACRESDREATHAPSKKWTFFRLGRCARNRWIRRACEDASFAPGAPMTAGFAEPRSAPLDSNKTRNCFTTGLSRSALVPAG